MASAGKLTGTCLTPGISKNGRLYTKAAIAKAVARAQARIEDGTNPLAMLTHHGAEDDSTRIVGRLTSITLADDGSAKFEAKLADTDHARDIATLIDPEDPFLTGVSIRGWWAEDPTVEVTPSGIPVETAGDLELDGLDFTRSPGVIGARIGESAPVAIGERGIAESIDEVLVEANKTPYGADVQYADPGYQKDKVKRYPLDTKAHAKAANSYIGQADNAALYTAAQLKRIKGRIKAALKKFGVDVSTESAPESPVTEAAAPVLEFLDAPCVSEVTECMYCGPDDSIGTAGFSVTLFNGPLTINLTAYSGIEAHKLGAIGAAAMTAAVQAVNILDPDTDGDVDGPMDGDEGDEAKPDDNNLETAPAGAATEIKETAPVSDTTAQESAPVEDAPAESAPAVEAAPAATEETAPEGVVEESEESMEDRIVAKLLAALKPTDAVVVAAVEAAPAAPVTEAAPVEPAVVVESEEQIRERVRVEERDALIESIRTGKLGLSRKGIVPNVVESTDPPKPLHEMNAQEFHDYKRVAGLADWAGVGA